MLRGVDVSFLFKGNSWGCMCVQVDKDLRVMLVKPDAPPPRTIDVTVWRRAIPQFNLHHLDDVQARSALLLRLCQSSPWLLLTVHILCPCCTLTPVISVCSSKLRVGTCILYRPAICICYSSKALFGFVKSSRVPAIVLLLSHFLFFFNPVKPGTTR